MSSWKKNEHRAAIAAGGWRQRGSGNSWRPSAKGDCRSLDCLYEVKTTAAPYFTLRRNMVDKLLQQARRAGLLTPVFIFVIQKSWWRARPAGTMVDDGRKTWRVYPARARLQAGGIRWDIRPYPTT